MKYSGILLSCRFSITLLVVCVFSPPILYAGEDSDEGSIEIYSAGQRYQSLEVYQEGQKRQDEDFKEQTREMFDEVVRTSKDLAHLEFDPQKVKTIVLQNPSARKKAARHESKNKVFNKDIVSHANALSHVGFDSGIQKVLADFDLSSTEKRIISATELERVLSNSLDASNQPILLISDKNNLRVMRFDDTQKIPNAAAEQVKNN